MNKLLKLLVISSLFVVFLLLPTVHAQETCSADEDCQREGIDDVYYKDTTSAECIHKTGGYCDSQDEFADERGCVFAYLTVDDNLCQAPPTSTPAPSQNPTPPPAGPTGPVPEEQAVYNLNQALLPKEVIPQTIAPDDPISAFFKGITRFFGELLFFQKPVNTEKVYVQSGSIQQSQLPPELKPDSNHPKSNLQDFLGASSGVYGVELPKDIQNQSIQDSERAFEKANFPTGIHPIMGY